MSTRRFTHLTLVGSLLPSLPWGVVDLGVGALTGGAIGFLFGAFATEWVPVTP